MALPIDMENMGGEDINDNEDGLSLQQLQSQFFIASDEASNLNNNCVLFGTITNGSPTIFDATHTGTGGNDGDEDNDDQNLDEAPCITKVKTLATTTNSARAGIGNKYSTGGILNFIMTFPCL